jgi:hypothetical protein
MNKFRWTTSFGLMVGFLLTGGQHLHAFTEDFDDLNAATRWTAYSGVGFDVNLASTPIDSNFDRLPTVGGVDGIIDDLSGFAFDYSSVGIPAAPNSLGGSTIGLKLQANLFSNALGGFSVSPNGLNLTGNYTVSFDAWSNTVGPFPSGGSGSTNMSTFGVLTSGTFSQSCFLRMASSLAIRQMEVPLLMCGLIPLKMVTVMTQRLVIRMLFIMRALEIVVRCFIKLLLERTGQCHRHKSIFTLIKLASYLQARLVSRGIIMRL